MASYYGEFVNPVQGTWRVASRPAPTGEDPSREVYFVEVFHEEEKTVDGVAGKFSWWAPHTSGHEWDEEEDAHQYIEDMEQSFEDDYDEYLEENRYEIAQMERYEMWRREH